MRTLSMFAGVMTLALALAMVGCGGGSDSNTSKTNDTGRSIATGECPGSSSSGVTQTCTGEEAYQDCVIAKCTPQMQSCFGGNFASGNFTGGVCADYMSCQMACPCDANASVCETTCGQKMLANASCMTCITTLTACVLASGCAQPVCTTSTATATKTTTSTATGTNGSCAAASACCTTLTAGANAAQYQATCAMIAAAGEPACAQILVGWQGMGVCK